MACQAIHSWTFSGLVGAFLDLFIAYFLLCGSSLVFFASRFLSIFGLYLPCPCDGLFSDPNRAVCFHKLLVDSPVRKISSVQLSAKTRFPFDSVFVQGRQLNFELIKDRDRLDGLIEGEASCSSSDARVQRKNELIRFTSMNSPRVQKGADDCKGKGVSNQRQRPGTLRRRRRAPVTRASLPPRGPEIMEDEESSVRVSSGNSGKDDLNNSEAHAGTQSDEGAQKSFHWNDLMRESKNFERQESSASASDVARNVQSEMGPDRGEVNTVRVLEQALEEERAARIGLYQELEMERSAAASAADEAMAMILRLQKEKASTEMEAKQYQRMIEEKASYDAEEMNILKEILIRREKEKHFLEKEVEVYRQVLSTSGNEDLLAMSIPRPRMSFDSSEDPSLILQQISEYIQKKEMIKSISEASNYDAASVASVERQGRVLDYGEESSEFQVKRLLSIEKHPSDVHGQWLEAEADSSFHNLNGSQEQNLVEKTIVVDEEEGKTDNVVQNQGVSTKNEQICENGINFSHNNGNMEKPGNEADQNQSIHNSSFEPTLLDVHVIDDKSKLFNQRRERSAEPMLMYSAKDSCKSDLQSETSSLRSVDISSDYPSTSRGRAQSSIRRSMSDMRSMLDKPQNRGLLSDMRRNSASSVSYERLKIENEVGWLTERLKIVQEGREKLSFSVEHKERERLHLQLLEDIASQLREIRQLTEPGKAVRQASLPPLSSKVGSKKRRCRSISMGLQGSSSNS